MHTPLEAHLHRTIQENGPIPFDRFMQEALYHPKWGYYESDQTLIGRRGDFQTSVSVGPFFGELLARQFWGWCEKEGTYTWVECGSHHGQLAEDILQCLEQLDTKQPRKVQYLMLEPSTKRRAVQKEHLKRFGSRVDWVADWNEVHTSFQQGVIFSNELLDAFPVKRFVWDKTEHAWKEYYVGNTKNGFQWRIVPIGDVSPNASLPENEFRQLEDILPDHYILERSPSAESWWQNAANHLKKGHLITLDYGLSGLEKYAPYRTNGTLRTYSHHRAGDDLLSLPGQKDLTAHVDFPLLQKMGEEAGLQTKGLLSQESFMHQCLEHTLKQGVQPSPKQLAQFRTLMHPEHFGKAFKVLVQCR